MHTHTYTHMDDPNESTAHDTDTDTDADADTDCHKSTMIDPIPSHELYASLVGISHRLTISNQAVEYPNCLANVHANVHVIPVEAKREPTTPLDLFSQVYNKAVIATAKTSQQKQSCLILDNRNKGFQLLRTMGWKEREGGLGRQQQGNLEPIKTVWKRNKQGLGTEPRSDTKIIHSAEQPLSSRFVKQKESKGLRRRRRRREQQQEWTKTKDIQFMLRTDVSEEYSQLYRSLHSHPTFRP